MTTKVEATIPGFSGFSFESSASLEHFYRSFDKGVRMYFFPLREGLSNSFYQALSISLRFGHLQEGGGGGEFVVGVHLNFCSKSDFCS